MASINDTERKAHINRAYRVIHELNLRGLLYTSSSAAFAVIAQYGAGPGMAPAPDPATPNVITLGDGSQIAFDPENGGHLAALPYGWSVAL